MPTPYRAPALPVARFPVLFPGILCAPDVRRPTARQLGSSAARQLGSSAARQLGSSAARRPTAPAPDRRPLPDRPTVRRVDPPAGRHAIAALGSVLSRPAAGGRLPPTPAARVPWRASQCRFRRSGGLPPAPAPAAPVAGALAGRAAVETALRTVQFQRRLYCDSPSPAGRTGGASPSRRTGGPAPRRNGPAGPYPGGRRRFYSG